MGWLSSRDALAHVNLWFVAAAVVAGLLIFLIEADKFKPTRPHRWKLWLSGVVVLVGVLALLAEVRLSQLDASASVPRLIAPDTRAAFLKGVGSGPKGTIHVKIRAQDPEAAVFGEQMLEMLLAGGWKVRGSHATATAPMPPGVVISVQTEPAPPEVLLLLGALNGAGIDASSRVLPGMPPDESPRLEIGQKE